MITVVRKKATVWLRVGTMRYQLKFFNAQELLVREFDIEADDDDSAIRFTCEQSIGFNMIAELCHEKRSVIRITPMKARLHIAKN